MLYIFFGTFFAIVTLMMWQKFCSHRKQVKQILQIPMSTIREIKNHLTRNGDSKYAKITGHVQCSEPITAKSSQELCVCYKQEISREYKKRNPGGTPGSPGALINRYEVIKSDFNSAQFSVDDGTGQIDVHPHNATMEMIEVLNKYTRDHREVSSLGRFTIEAKGSKIGRTSGYRIIEQIIPNGQQVYIVGEVVRNHEQLIVKKPDNHEPLIISVNSEEERLYRHKQNAQFSVIACGCFLLLTLGFIIYGLKIENFI